MVLLLALYLSHPKLRVRSFWRGIVFPSVIFGVCALLVGLEPHLSGAILVCCIGLIMIISAGANVLQMVPIGLACVAGAVALYFSKEYMQQRVYTWLHPESDPTGAGYHVLQSKIAIGSGQLTGNGYKNGPITQNGLLPAAKTDFVFGALGEEFGFFACILLLFLLFFMIWRTFYAAINAKDSFGELLCVGVGAMLSFHVIENVGMCIGLLPVTGIPLPLISHGGSNVLATMMALGIVQSVVVHRRAVHFQ